MYSLKRMRISFRKTLYEKNTANREVNKAFWLFGFCIAFYKYENRFSHRLTEARKTLGSKTRELSTFSRPI